MRLQEKESTYEQNELERKVLEGNIACKERKLNEHQELIMPPWAYTSL